MANTANMKCNEENKENYRGSYMQHGGSARDV